MQIMARRHLQPGLPVAVAAVLAARCICPKNWIQESCVVVAVEVWPDSRSCAGDPPAQETPRNAMGIFLKEEIIGDFSLTTIPLAESEERDRMMKASPRWWQEAGLTVPEIPEEAKKSLSRNMDLEGGQPESVSGLSRP